MGSGKLWLAGMPSLGGTFHQDPSNPLFSPYFLFPFPPPILQLPFNGDTGSPPSLLARRTEAKPGKIPTIILNHETGAFVISFRNRSRTQNTRESAAHAWTAPGSSIPISKKFPVLHNDPFPYNAEEQRHDKGKETCKTADDRNG